MQNANSTWLNCRPFDRDLEVALETPVRLANDANCFALSEAIDGAAENAHIVSRLFCGTGCSGGLVVNGKVINGPAVLPESRFVTVALGHLRRIPRTLLLVRPPRVLGDLGLRPGMTADHAG